MRLKVFLIEPGYFPAKEALIPEPGSVPIFSGKAILISKNQKKKVI
jgi:hypothetical protein